MDPSQYRGAKREYGGIISVVVQSELLRLFWPLIVAYSAWSAERPLDHYHSLKAYRCSRTSILALMTSVAGA